MVLPKKISPNPLLTSTIEIRFDSTLTDDQVLKTFYPILAGKFPNFKEANIPKQIRQPGSPLEFAADFVFSSNAYSISVGKNVVAFENVGEYHFWGNYFDMIQENLNVLDKINVVKSIRRVGVRYASFFGGKNDVAKILKPKIGFAYSNYSEQLQVYQTNFKRDSTNLFLQIAPNAVVQKDGSIPVGFLIDIDASVEGKGNLMLGAKLFEIINKLHDEGKELFFTILNDDFLKSLNPEY